MSCRDLLRKSGDQAAKGVATHFEIWKLVEAGATRGKQNDIAIAGPFGRLSHGALKGLHIDNSFGIDACSDEQFNDVGRCRTQTDHS